MGKRLFRLQAVLVRRVCSLQIGFSRTLCYRRQPRSPIPLWLTACARFALCVSLVDKPCPATHPLGDRLVLSTAACG